MSYWKMPPNVYPTLSRWMINEDYSPERMALDLYITATAVRHRLSGNTPFTRLEEDRLSEIAKIPRKQLFRKGEK